jgi:hypothetical protein
MQTKSAHRAVASTSPPTVPRLRMQQTGARPTLLDGGWWPRSTDPVAELPGLVLAIDGLHGLVTGLVLSDDGWDTHPRRLKVAGRVLRLGYFTSQNPSLLTAICGNGDRVDLLIVPPGTERHIADAAMILAATSGNVVHAPYLLASAGAAQSSSVGSDGEDAWEGEGGHLERAGALAG